jgi:general secretion pathway protein J
MMGTWRDVPAHEAGFTLIELLVSLVILGLSAAMLVAGLNTAWLVSPARMDRSGDDESIVAAQRILRARLERLAPVVRLDSSKPIVDAQGEARVFSFYAPPLSRNAPDALQRYRLILTSSRDLVLYSASGLNDVIDIRDPSLSGWAPTRLLSGVDQMTITYFGSDRITQGERWQAFWIDRPQPPALIRIRLGFVQGDRRQWPDLVIRPRATVNTVCRIDRFTGRCDGA